MRLRPLSLVAAAFVAACALPTRDNPVDPAHRPVPVLLVKDVSRADGSCPCSATDGVIACEPFSGSTVAAVSRGRCLALDPLQSTDPDESAPDLEFRFFLHTTSGDVELVSPANGLLTTGGVFILGASFRASLPVSTEIAFVVRAQDRQGNHARGESSITLLNSRPQLRVPSSRTYPLKGLPWLRDLPGGAPDYEIEFRADGLVDEPDPSDVDHLVHCWTIDDGPEICRRDSSHPDFTLTLDPDVERIVPAFLRVSDWSGPEEEAVLHPETFSNTVRTRVAIGSPPLWLRDADGTYGLERMDPLHESLASIGGTSIQSQDPIFAAPFGDLLAYALTNPTSGITLLDEDGGPAPPSFSLPMDAELLDLVADAQHDRVWFAYESSFPADEPLCTPATTDPHLTLRAFDASLIERVCVHLPLYGDKPRPIQLTLAPDGAVWAADRFGSALYRIPSADGAQAQTIIPENASGPVILDVESRPDSPEIWVFVRSQPFDSPEISQALANVFDASTQALLDTWELGTSDTLLGPWWVDGDRFWTFNEAAGMRLVDARALSDSLGIDGATVLSTPIAGILDANSIESELADPATGGFWGRMAGLPQIQAVFVSAEGAPTYFDSRIFHPQFIDERGALWQTSLQEDLAIPAYILESGFVPGDRGVVTTIPALTLGAQPDLDGGGAWSAGVLSPGISRFAENGRLQHSMTSYFDLDSNEPSAIPPIIDLQLSPDASNAWALGFSLSGLEVTDIFWFDLETGAGRAVVSTAGNLGINVIAATVPAPAAEPFAWVVRDPGTGTGLQAQKLTSSSLEAPLFTFPATEHDAVGAVSPRTNALCVVTRDPIGEVVIRRILPDGTVHLLGRATSSASSRVLAVSHEPEDICWARVFDGTEQIMGWTDDGDANDGPDRQLGIGGMPGFEGELGGLIPVSADEIWVLLDPPEGGSHLVRYEFTTSSTALARGQFRGPRGMRPLPMGLDYEN